jgi:hypothetical protein
MERAFPSSAFPRSYFVCLSGLSCHASASTPHFLSTFFASHISRIKTMETARTRNCKPQSAYTLMASWYPAHSPFLCSALCPAVASAALSGLCSYSCVFAIFHTFSLDFSLRVATHARRGDIQPPSPLCHFKFFFSSSYRSQSPLTVLLLLKGMYRFSSSFLTFLPFFSFVLLLSFPCVNQARTEQALLFFFFSFPFLSSYVSVPSIRNHNRTSYL